MGSEITRMSKEELLSCLSQRKEEIAYKVKNKETEQKFAIGAEEYTNKEWEKLIAKVDKNIEDVKEMQAERKEGQLKNLYEKGSAKYNSLIAKLNGTYKNNVPYGYLAEDGIIDYNGIIFLCDEEKNAICLGDVSDRSNVLTIPLSGGGCLMVNRDNLGELSQAITMFSPEDMNRIMRAIADDKKAQEMQKTIEDEVNSIGDDAENEVFEEQVEELIF